MITQLFSTLQYRAMLTGNQCASTILIFRHVFIIWSEQRRLALPQKVALCIITSQTFVDTVCTLLSKTDSGPCFSVGTLCMARSVPWFTKIRPTDSGSDKTMGVHSAQCKNGSGRCWIYTVFSFMNPMQNCVLFLTMKSLSTFFHLFVHLFVRANFNTVSWATGNGVNTRR